MPDLGNDGSPLIVHIIPSPRGRGAQRAARILVDQLDEPGVIRHQLLGLFEGPPEVKIDLDIAYPAGESTAKGFDPRLARRLRHFLKRLDPVIVVAHGGDAMKYAMPAVLGTGRPLAYCVIGTYAGAPVALHQWVWKQIMARADVVVAVGDEVLDECTGRFGVSAHKAIMIPNGRDPTLFRPRREPVRTADPRLIFVGALTPQKQPDRFMAVVRLLRNEGRSVRAVVVGDGPLADSLAGMAPDQGIELLGARSDVPELLRESDLLVFTSRPAGEGMPGVLIEAGLSGIPVVSTRVPGAATVLRDGNTGLIVDDSPSSIAMAVGQLLDDPESRAAMGSSARTWCESAFTLDLMAERWRAALDPLVTRQADAACLGAATRGRRVSALRRAMRSLRFSSQT